MTEPLAGLVRHQYLLFTLYQTDMAQQQIVDPITQLNSDTQAPKGTSKGLKEKEPLHVDGHFPTSKPYHRAFLFWKGSPPRHTFSEPTSSLTQD